VWFILISSWTINNQLIDLINITFFFFFCFEGATLISPSSIVFETLCTPPIERLFWNSSPKIETNISYIAHLFSLYYMRRTLGKPYGINVRCYWELLGEQLGEPLGNWCEHTGNKDPKPPPPQTRLFYLKKKTGPLMSAWWGFSLIAWNFYFQNCLSLFLAWANGKGTTSGT
jgi:hypothetical protein